MTNFDVRRIYLDHCELDFVICDVRKQFKVSVGEMNNKKNCPENYLEEPATSFLDKTGHRSLYSGAFKMLVLECQETVIQ